MLQAVTGTETWSNVLLAEIRNSSDIIRQKGLDYFNAFPYTPLSDKEVLTFKLGVSDYLLTVQKIR
jgi:hypothetical protein